MLVIVAQNIPLSNDVYSKASMHYLTENTQIFKLFVIGVTAVVLLMNYGYIFVDIKFKIVNPVEKLTQFIMKPDKTSKEELEYFIEEILKKAGKK